MNNRVSIVTVTYNLKNNSRLEYFKQCVESIRMQDYKNIEHIVIDGASTDGTVDILNHYYHKGYFTYISEPDNGIYDAMNKGIKISTGKYVTFLNSDDYYTKADGITKSIEVLEENNADFCGSDTNFITPEGTFLFERKVNLNNVFTEMPFCHQTMVTKRSVLMAEGMFNTKFQLASDYNFIITLFLKRYKGVMLNYNFVNFRLGGKSEHEWGTAHKEIINLILPRYNYSFNKKEIGKIFYMSQLPSKVAVGLNKYLYPLKISIITIVKNLSSDNSRLNFDECIKSVYEQIYPNIEHIVVDMNSTDNTLEILMEYENKYKIIVANKDKSLVGSNIFHFMKFGVNYSRGDYVYFLNKENCLIDCNVIKDIVEIINQSAADVLLSYCNNLIQTKTINTNLLKKFLIEHELDISLIFYRKKLFEYFDFFHHTIPYGSDLYFNVTLADAGYRFKYISRQIIKNTINLANTITSISYNSLTKKLVKILYCDRHINYYFFNFIPILKMTKNNKIFKLYLFNFIPIVKIKVLIRRAKIYKIYLFNLIIFLKIRRDQTKLKIFLCNFIPILKTIRAQG